MSLLGDLGTKIGAKLKSITTRVDALENAPVSSSLDSGGTINGDLTINGKLSLGDDIGKEEWGHIYRASITNIVDLVSNNGSGLGNGGAYRVTAHISSTSTNQAAMAVFWNQDGVWKVNNTARGSAESNNINFQIKDNKPAIGTWHSQDYSINVYHERITLSENGTDNTGEYFGADSYMSKLNNTLYFQDKEVFHEGNLPTYELSEYKLTNDVTVANDTVHQLFNVLKPAGTYLLMFQSEIRSTAAEGRRWGYFEFSVNGSWYAVASDHASPVTHSTYKPSISRSLTIKITESSYIGVLVHPGDTGGSLTFCHGNQSIFQITHLGD
jgi:hypothetical protein